MKFLFVANKEIMGNHFAKLWFTEQEKVSSFIGAGDEYSSRTVLSLHVNAGIISHKHSLGTLLLHTSHGMLMGLKSSTWGGDF